MALVWTSTMKDATEVEVLSRLASHANEDGESCFAGVPRIAKLVRRSERTVQRTIESLERDGWLSVVRGGGAGNLTQYLINVEKLKGCQDVTLLSKPKRVTLAQKRVTLATKKGDIGAAPPIEGNVFKRKSKQTPPNPPPAGGAKLTSDPNADELDAATERLIEAFGLTRRRDRRRLRAQVEALSARGEPPAAVADAMIAADRKPRELREREQFEAMARADEANERESWLRWREMSPMYKSINPWRGRVFEEDVA